MKPIRKIALTLSAVLALGALAGCACSKETVAYSEVPTYAAEEEPAYGAQAEPVFYASDYDVPMEMAVSGSAGVARSTSANSASQTASQEASAYRRKVIYNATLSLTADEPRKVLDTVSARAAALGGYLSASYERSYSDGTIQVTATVKVPAEGLNDLLAEMEKLGKVDSSRLSSDDISQSYYDIEARLRAAKAEEEQLLKLLEKCNTVKDMLAVREQLAYVRSDIESYQAQINLWDHQVAYATIDLTVKQTPKTAAQTDDGKVELWKFSDVARKMKNGFENSWRSVVNGISSIGIFLANSLLPLLIFGAIVFGIVKLIIFLVKKGAAKRAARKQAKTENKEEKKDNK